MAATEIARGAVLAERYTLARRLGAGGMAAVWLADDDRLARQVAVKVIAETFAFDERYRQRFAREARAAAAVSHPNIVPVYDYGLEGEHPFLVMEYIAGGNLADLFAGRGAVTVDPAELARELLGALDCVHGAGLVHRDIKPANILLDQAGRARLTDFGIAQPEDATSLTQTGMVIGTLRYLAPEVIAGGTAGPSADLYAAGVVLRDLTERHPSPELAPLIKALTASHPDDRPSTAVAALQSLGAARETAPDTASTLVVPATAPPPSPPRRAGRSTAPTARLRSQTPSPAQRAGAALAAHDVSPRTAALVALGALAIVVVLILRGFGGGTSSPTRSTTTPRPASAGAPLADQLSSLRRLVNHAAAP